MFKQENTSGVRLNGLWPRSNLNSYSSSSRIWLVNQSSKAFHPLLRSHPSWIGPYLSLHLFPGQIVYPYPTYPWLNSRIVITRSSLPSPIHKAKPRLTVSHRIDLNTCHSYTPSDALFLISSFQFSPHAHTFPLLTSPLFLSHLDCLTLTHTESWSHDLFYKICPSVWLGTYLSQRTSGPLPLCPAGPNSVHGICTNHSLLWKSHILYSVFFVLTHRIGSITMSSFKFMTVGSILTEISGLFRRAKSIIWLINDTHLITPGGEFRGSLPIHTHILSSTCIAHTWD